MPNTAQSAQLDDQETRVPGAPALHGRAPILYVLCSDDTLLLELGPLLGTRYRTRPIDSAEQLAPISSTPWALLIDACGRPDARAQAASVKQEFPFAPLLVVCPNGTGSEWASPLARGALTAVVERSALGSPSFEAALDALDGQMPAGGTLAERTGAAQQWWRRPATIVTAATLLAGAAAAAWYISAARTNNRLAAAGSTLGVVRPPPAQPRAPVAAVAAPRTVLELLSDARVAFRDGKSLLPPMDGSSNGSSALELYSQVLVQEPHNEEAHDGLRRLFAVASARIRADLKANKTEDADRLLAAFHDVSVDPAAIAALDSEIAAARPHALLAQARAAAAKGDAEATSRLMTQLAAAGGDRAALSEVRESLDTQRGAARLSELANHARALIKAGALLEPPGDSAQSTVLAMQQLNRGSQLTLNTERELQAALIERTLAASRAGQYDLAQQLLNSAAILGNGPELAAARTLVQTATEANHARAVPIATAPPSETATAAASEGFVRAKPLVPLDVEYPKAAYAEGKQGYVIVEFILDARGHASDPKVIESRPGAVFDGAAVQAVRHGYFDTSELGSSNAPRRARLRIAFKPIVKLPGE